MKTLPPAPRPAVSIARPGAPLRPRRGHIVAVRLAALTWPVLTVLLVIIAAQIPLMVFPRYFFIGDTESGAVGQWWEVGTRLMSGQTSPLNPTVWQAGVYLADGAWGFYSPLIEGLGLLIHQIDDLLLFTDLVKTAILSVAGLGVYVLGRSFGVTRPWSMIAGVAAPLAGFTMYQDISSWVTGAISWSMFPWVWAGLRAFTLRRRTIFAALIPAALLIGIVYTDATLVVIATVVAVGVEAIVSRRIGAVVRILVVGFIIAMMVVIAHLPALLVYPSTGRVQGIEPDTELIATVASLLQAGIPFGRAATNGIGDVPTTHPLTYLFWLTPLIVLVRPKAFARLLGHRSSLIFMAIALLVFVQVPLAFGPLRWPARTLPYLAVTVILILALGLSRVRAPRPGTLRVLLALLLWATGASIAWLATAAPALSARAPTAAEKALATSTTTTATTIGGLAVAPPEQIIVTGIGSMALGILLLLLIPALSRYRGRRSTWRHRITLVLIAVVSVVVVLPQHSGDPIPGGAAQGLSTDTRDYGHMLDGAVGDVFVVGSERSGQGAAMAREAAIGNAWYMTNHPVQNVYSTLQYPLYAQLLCMRANGINCTNSFRLLRVPELTTGKLWADLFGISSILLIKTQYLGRGWAVLPAGWHVVHDTALTRLIVRDHPVPGAGSVVWTAPGTAVTVQRATPTTVSFTVRAVGTTRTVALSRLPWPGYSASGGARVLKAATAGVLLTVQLPADAVGRTITVRYTPPGTPQIHQAQQAGGLVLVVWLAISLLAFVVPGLGWLFPGRIRFRPVRRVRRWIDRMR